MMRHDRTWVGAFAVAVLMASMASAGAPPAPSIVFPSRWVGNIDKVDFNEPSGLCWHSGRQTLFVVGDDGDIAELKADGTQIKQKRIRKADFEGITHDPSTGLLYVAVEGEESIIEIDPDTFAVLREFQLPRTFEGTTVLHEGGQGIEGITFVPDAAHPHGGVFHVANQAFDGGEPGDLSAIFRVELPLRGDGDGAKILGYSVPGVIDLAGLHYDAGSDHLFVISDAANVMLELTRGGTLVGSWALPGDNQEGITADGEGFIYFAQDSGGIIKLEWLRSR